MSIVLSVSFITLALSFLLFVFPSFLSKADEDVTAPVLLDLVLSTDEINTDLNEVDGDNELTVWARVSDDMSGVANVSAVMRPVGYDADEENMNMQNQNFSLYLKEGTCEDIDGFIDLDGLDGCGDEYDGIYEANLTFLLGSTPGDWMLMDFTVTDALNNFQMWSREQLNSGFWGVADFTNLGTSNDTAGPQLVDYSFDKASIDTDEGTDTLVLTARISDDLSGVATNQYVRFGSPEYLHNADFGFELQEGDCVGIDPDIDKSGLVGCGDSNDGIYIATHEFPQYSAYGEWVDSGMVFSDMLGNQRSIESFDATFTNTALTQDIIPPVLKAISISPIAFDSSGDDVTITVQMELEDGLSGVSTEQANFVIRPLISSQGVQISGLTRVSGDANDGVFEGEITIPQYSKQGLWLIDGMGVSDNLSNGLSYSGRDLAEMFPEQEFSIVNQALASEITIEEDWVIEDWVYRDAQHNLVWPPINVTFEAGTVITKAQGGSLAFYRMLTQNYVLGQDTNIGTFLNGVNSQYATDLQACNVSEGCVASSLNTNNLVGRPINMVKMGIPGLKLSFSKPVIITLRVDEDYLGETFVIQTFDTDTNAWVNQATCTVAMVDPWNTEHGGDEYGEIMPAPYPACRFTTDHASFFSANVLGIEDEDAGVPRTGLGGLSNSVLGQYFGWVK